MIDSGWLTGVFLPSNHPSYKSCNEPSITVGVPDSEKPPYTVKFTAMWELIVVVVPPHWQIQSISLGPSSFMVSFTIY